MSGAELEAELNTASKANKLMDLEEVVEEKPPTFSELAVEVVKKSIPAPLVLEKLREAESVKEEQPKIEKKIASLTKQEALRTKGGPGNYGGRNPFTRRNPYGARPVQRKPQQQRPAPKQQ